MKKHFLWLLVFPIATGCTTVNVDQVQLATDIELTTDEAVVILGRHHSAEFETEPSLVRCVGNRVANLGVGVIPEDQFVNDFYPYFEARTAPLKPQKLKIMLESDLLKRSLDAIRLKYMVWIEGSTERTGQAGSMSCTITGAGGGCFGFGTWEDTSDYEAIIWDVTEFKEVARVSTDAVGTSYMPAFVVPVPLIARVQSSACEGLGKQLGAFLSGESTALSVSE